MKKYTTGHLLSSLGADAEKFPEELLSRSIAGVSTDSRTIKKGDVFFALRGDRFDGADYVEKVIESGALCAVVNADSMKSGFGKLPVIPVGDTVRALGDAARDYRSMFTGTVIAVTGTTGKTTAKEMMLTILGKRLKVHGTKGNYNNFIGLPLSVFGLSEEHECAVFELGMSAPGEIAYLAGIAQPDVGVILNVGPAHMEYFTSLEAVAEAKMELLDVLGSSGTLVINGDDELLKSVPSRCKCSIVNFGINAPCNYLAENVVINPDGCPSFDVEGHHVTLKVPGLHNVYNALAAYTIGIFMGVGGSEAGEALENFTAPDKRMQVVMKNGVRYINDSYNANPMSMKCAAEVLKAVDVPNGGRKIAVLGNMLELGDFTEDAHLKTGTVFAGLGLEWLCLVGGNAVHYEKGAVEGGMNPEKIRSFTDVEAASRFIDGIKRPCDVILIKGSRRMEMEKVFGQ